jgi:hypothetical protein
LIDGIVLVMEVEGEGKWKRIGEEGTATPFRWNGGTREANSGAVALGRNNGGGVRLETSWGGGPKVGQKASRAGMKLGQGE